jgi:hypothetical protein
MDFKITIDRPEGSAEVTVNVNTDDDTLLEKIQSALEAQGISVERLP